MKPKAKSKRRSILLTLLAGFLVCCSGLFIASQVFPTTPIAEGQPTDTALLQTDTAEPTPTNEPPTATATAQSPTATTIVVEQATPEAEAPTPAPTTTTDVSPATGTLTVHFIDVGQGDAILIQSPDGKNMLIDGGERNTGVVAYLAATGVSKLDIVAATHPHSDHIGGLVDVLKSIPVDKVVTNGQEHTSGLYESFLDEIIASQAEYVEVKAGDTIQLGMLTLEVLGPISLTSSLNNGSLVLRLVYGDIAFLFTGDAEAQAESRILSSGRSVQAQILKVGHHASNTSSTQAFVNAVSPEVAVYQAGVGNKYGHPHAEIIARLSAMAEVYGTDQHGTVIVTTDGMTYTVSTQKQASQPAPAPTVVQAEAPAQLSLEVLSHTSPISAGSTANLKIKTLPGAECTITVYYKSGASKASGLDPKTANANGEVSWSWKVGSNTSPGDWRIVVTASQGGKTAMKEIEFIVN
jgi:beta-lactamase superfamily II metal-dependent hydrolase